MNTANTNLEALRPSTLRPGVMVSLKTSIKGGIEYNKTVLEATHIDEDGASRASWTTQRTIDKPAEHEAAKKTRSQARARITGVCAATNFGLLCPESKLDDLKAAIAEARADVNDFNNGSDDTKVNLFVLTGRMESDDVEAIRAINSELRDLLDEMEAGIGALDVDKIREAANKATKVRSMLSDDASERIKQAVANARGVARKIVQAGEQVAEEIKVIAIRNITEARTAFLDLDAPASEVAAPTLEGRGLDLVPVDQPSPTPAAAPAPQFEMESE